MGEHPHAQLYRELAARVARIEGHTRAVARMLEEGRSCPEILHQVRAVKAAWDKVAAMLFDEHLKVCVVHAVRDGTLEQSLEGLREALKEYLGQ
ncbi:MAG: metal-sensitive transcriptional regulator [Bacillota bacterium]|nr:metal-sensitive transcriptional regulator [Bacillota bacterium]